MNNQSARLGAEIHRLILEEGLRPEEAIARARGLEAAPRPRPLLKAALWGAVGFFALLTLLTALSLWGDSRPAPPSAVERISAACAEAFPFVEAERLDCEIRLSAEHLIQHEADRMAHARKAAA